MRRRLGTCSGPTRLGIGPASVALGGGAIRVRRIAALLASILALPLPAAGPVNRLIHEKSPYLLQHAHNPVDWYPWGPEAFSRARRENRPIFLSVGYSTCHWCHVMERESFENEQIAATLNRSFVAIKVDREERPDIDGLYMTFVQATTGGGGWPMSVWLTPDLKPFYGGTYFPPEQFRAVLDRVAEAWKSDRRRIVSSSEEVVGELQRIGQPRPGKGAPTEQVLDAAFRALRSSYDAKYGGFGTAPKFPQPVVLNFLLRQYARTGNKAALDMVTGTLRAMSSGGINDQLGGGFHRYSTDQHWFAPHFEKMLYDQAQIALSAVEVFQITKDPFYASTARRIFDYVLRDMTDPSGGFYSAEDADSADNPSRPDLKSEGAYYLWTWKEIEAALQEPAAEWFGYRYGVLPGGNSTKEERELFPGRNVLYEAHTVEETALHFDHPAGPMRTALESARSKLLAVRARRPRPQRDDKILTSWNSLMITAFSAGARALDEPRYARAAKRSADFLLTRMYNPRTGLLLRRYRDGNAAIPGFLEDYAFFAQALLDLYETTFELRYLQAAISLTTNERTVFEDRTGGGFYLYSADDKSLLFRRKDDSDGALPAGNSIAVLNLLRLAQITDSADLRRSAEKALEAHSPVLSVSPAAFPQMLIAAGFARSKPKQIILAGPMDQRMEVFLRAVNQRFLPNKVVLVIDGPEAREVLSKYLPVVSSMAAKDGKPTAYVCENYACKLPTTDVNTFRDLLN